MFFIHDSSYIDGLADVGNGTHIWHFCHIEEGATIGKNCVLGQNVYVGKNVHIGNNVKIQNNVSIYTGVTIEDNVFVGPSAVFTNVVDPRSFIEKKDEFKETLVCEGASIGANATIVCGNTIGSYSMVGAGSVVTKDVPAYTIVYGVPAEYKGAVNERGDRL